MWVRLSVSIFSLLLVGCGGSLRHYELANYGPGDTSAGDVTHASDSQARVVTPKRASEHAARRDSVTQTAYYGHDGPAVLPDDKVTPGVVRTADQKAICDPKFRTKPFRLTTQAMKDHVYAAYGVERNKGICNGGCEVDHRLPLELGGLDDERNLWPQPSQPKPGFHEKDKLENALKKAVCKDHTLTLAEAQKELLGDWYAAYLEMQKGAK